MCCRRQCAIGMNRPILAEMTIDLVRKLEGYENDTPPLTQKSNNTYSLCAILAVITKQLDKRKISDARIQVINYVNKRPSEIVRP